jgi:hypothetical protein
MEIDRNKLSEVKQKILAGLDLVKDKLLESKKHNNQDIVIFKDGKIQHIKSSDL